MFIRVLHMFCALELIQYTQENNHSKILPKKLHHGCIFLNFINFLPRLFEKTHQGNCSSVVLSQLQKTYLESS